MSMCKCPICGGCATVNSTEDVACDSYYCNACGNFYLERHFLNDIFKDIFASFLFYNNTHLWQNGTNSPYFIGSQKKYDELLKEYSNTKLVTVEDAQEWYPKRFNEKINCILLMLDHMSDYAGSTVQLSYEQMRSIFFVKHHMENTKIAETEIDCTLKQVSFISRYMVEQGFVSVSTVSSEESQITIKPEGLKRIDELQKNQSSSKQAFVAMSFAKDMDAVRDAIRDGIGQAGYVPRFMDEIEHNKQIVPEMLYEIKQSKFVVAEFTKHNNGAYYEAGYAAGLGKDVIHICRKDTFGQDGHFDVKQKYTILWEQPEELCDKLCKHIKATIS